MTNELSAYVTNLGRYNEGSLVGEWAAFPMSESDFAALLERIGVDGKQYEEWFVTDYDGPVVSNLYDHFGEYPSFKELNRWAERFGELASEDPEKLKAVLSVAEPTDIENLVNDPYEFDNWRVYPDVFTETELGYEIAEELGIAADDSVESRYFDYRKFGQDYNIESQNGQFTKYGYIERV